MAFGVIALSLRLAFAPSLSLWLNLPARFAKSEWRSDTSASSAERIANRSASETSRAYAVADAVASNQRREQQAAIAAAGFPQTALATIRTPETIRESRTATPAVPLGQSYNRTARRVSSAATQRSRRQ
jgi:hypothetical protein